MSRHRIHALAGLFVAAAAAVSCTEYAVAPKPRMLLPLGVPSLDVIVDHIAEDSSSADFTVTPTGGYFRLGPHAIYFPANAICDPAKSTYGVTEWDQPCEVLAEPIQIHAEVRKDSTGLAWVDFTPSLRFAPSDDANQYVWIFMKSDSVSSAEDVSRFAVLWSVVAGEPGVDEAVTDSTLVTYVNRENGVVFRRIKHFTGYSLQDGIIAQESELISGIVSEIFE